MLLAGTFFARFGVTGQGDSSVSVTVFEARGNDRM